MESASQPSIGANFVIDTQTPAIVDFEVSADETHSLLPMQNAAGQKGDEVELEVGGSRESDLRIASASGHVSYSFGVEDTTSGVERIDCRWGGD